MTRDENRARDLEARGVEPIVCDLVDPPSLARACAGVDRVFAAAHGALGRGKYRSQAVDDIGHRALIDAARAAGVSRFVYTSALGAAADHPVDFFRTKYAIEQYLAQSGLDYVVLRPTALMEWHVHTFNGKAVLEKGRAVILGSGRKRRNFVAARDVAAVAMLALTRDEPERLVSIAGPGNYTNDDVAQLYARIAGMPARISHLPRPAIAAIGGIARPFHEGIARVMRIASLPDDTFDEACDAPEWAGHVIGATSLEAFVRERVLEHRASATV